MEKLSFENAAYETICKVTVANMATFDIEKFKMHRQRVYYALLQKISRTNIQSFTEVGEHYEKLLKIISTKS
jgi:hypothetical protein